MVNSKKPQDQPEDVAEKDLPTDNKRWLKLLKKYQFSIAIIVLIVTLGVVILAMADLFSSANDTSNYNESSAVINFSQDTINQIRVIEKSSSQQTIELPSAGRVNPFAN